MSSPEQFNQVLSEIVNEALQAGANPMFIAACLDMTKLELQTGMLQEAAGRAAVRTGSAPVASVPESEIIVPFDFKGVKP